MIRLRIERQSLELDVPLNGLIWFEDGDMRGRVIIEQRIQTYGGSILERNQKWVPVEVIECPTE